MQLHHFEQFYKFYLYSEEKTDIAEEDALKGYGIPAGSTAIAPPKCQESEIPIFQGGEWKIVTNDFWRPSVKEINYDAGRAMDTFKYVDLPIADFMKFPSMPQLCNTSLVAMRISQSLKIINKKFDQCIEMHKMILQNGGVRVIDSLHRSSLTCPPLTSYEFKTELESIVFIMRRVLDSLVQLTDLMVFFPAFEKTKTLSHASVGSVLSLQDTDNPVKNIILGSDKYRKDTTKFLKISNDLFNGFKHTLMHDESFNKISESEEVPTLVGFLVKYENHKKDIQYHNHNSYYFMMGFQDCVARILYNQEIYRQSE